MALLNVRYWFQHGTLGNVTRRATATATVIRQVVGYVRVSKSRDEQTSTTTQRQAIERYCAERGWVLVGVFEDDGRSAFKAGVRRPGLDQALRMITSGNSDCLMVWKLDRFVRSSKDFGDRWATLSDAGAEFVSVTDNFDTTTAMGRAMLQIAVVFAELESAIKSERIGEWQDYRVAEGLTPTGPRPFGYERNEEERNVLTIAEDEAEVIRDAAAAVLDGESLAGIVKRLKATGVVGKNGTPISRRALAAILTNPTTAGGRLVDDVFLPGGWEEILDYDIWTAVRAVLTDPERRNGPGNARRWLLAGLLTCSTCKTPMGSKPHTSGTRYYCSDCHRSIDAAKTNDVVSGWMLDKLDAAAWASLRRRGRAPRPGVDLQSELDALVKLYGAGEITASEWHIARDGIMKRSEEAKQAYVELPDVDDIRSAWAGLGVDAKRLVVSAVFNSVVVLPYQRGANSFDSRRIDADWAV